MEEGLVKRFRDLEVSQGKLREQLRMVLDEGRRREEDWMAKKNNIIRSGGDGRREEEYGEGVIPGYFSGNPYQSVLQHIGHALHVCRPDTGEIIYWNQSAENLYGWKEHEALGQKVADLLVEEESHPFLRQIVERLSNGQSWSGHFPFRKRSEETFMAIVTQSPLLENGELIGVITVSSDAAMLNEMYPEKSKVHWNEANSPPRECKQNFKRVQWRLKPQITSSVSSLATKIFPRNHANSNNEGENFQERCGCILEKYNVQSEETGISVAKTISRVQAGLRAIEEKTYKYEETISKFNQQSQIAAKVLAKLNIRGNSNQFQESDERCETKSAQVMACTSVKRGSESCQPISSDNCTCCDGSQNYGSNKGLHGSDQVHRQVDEDDPQSMKVANFCTSDFSNVSCKIAPAKRNNGSDKRIECSDKGCSLEETRNGSFKGSENDSSCLKESEKKDDAQHTLENFKEELSAQASLQKKHSPQKKVVNSRSPTSTTSEETMGGSQAVPSLADDIEPNSVTDCDIRWDDLLLGEEIGEGSFAIVYRGVWNGSDVAIKVYLGKDYREGLLMDYKKEIAIMKRLRHPNVLLFMGAAYSPDRLAIVTEFLPRGSLFKALHKNNQKLDLKRRLRMALDVARGMNYLHRRNPPIIHRDLKSSNLLVDKNWNVKVGDFGLSCLKISTVLTATSGRGTPQWMAPEVLRGECSNEKSDVFSFGVILWELITESIPWSHLNSVQVIGVVGFMDRRLDLPEGLDPRVSSIICDCWESNPGQRPSFQELVGRMVDLAASVTQTLPPRRPEHQIRVSSDW